MTAGKRSGAAKLLREFVEEKLGGELDRLRTFDVKSLQNSEKFGCPGRCFDCDDTELMRAVYVVLWGDVLPELAMETLGGGKMYRGDTMNTFHTMFGRNIPERPGFYAGLEKYGPPEGLRRKVRLFGESICGTLGNFVVLPNLGAENTTLNLYRGTNDWRDFFDRFLIELEKVLCGSGEKDPLLAKLVEANAFCFDIFTGEEGFRALVRLLLLEDYCGAAPAYKPQIIFPLNYHWRDPAARETYLADAEKYLSGAEKIIENRGRRMVALLKTKLA
ncbi:MAG: hypothetical protein IJS01_15580 [Lentisphaeria bacterium]|nr:hypothetical protein [Lentisphaeria bacterium]